MSDDTSAGEPIERVTEPGSQADADAARDRLEGTYTEVDGEAPHVRGLAGNYTRTEGHETDESGASDYASTDEHPHVHAASERRGKYARADHGEKHGD